MAGKLRVTMAVSEYNHVADLISGRIGVEGVELQYMGPPVAERLTKSIRVRDCDISEMSYGRYVHLVSQGNAPVAAIPVFLSRMHQFGSIFVHTDGPTKVSELRGLKVGVAGWAETGAIYLRGIMEHDLGIGLNEVTWCQAGTIDNGGQESVKIKWPRGVTCTDRSDATLEQLLAHDEVDAAFCGRPPASFGQGDSGIKRMYPDYRGVEKDYWERTGIFPIMHAVVIRREVIDAEPWVARNVQTAFEQARDKSIERVFDMTASRVPLPWAMQAANNALDLFSQRYWPYGIDANSATLDAFVQYAYEQGVAHRRVTVEELFPMTLQSHYRI